MTYLDWNLNNVYICSVKCWTLLPERPYLIRLTDFPGTLIYCLMYIIGSFLRNDYISNYQLNKRDTRRAYYTQYIIYIIEQQDKKK